MGFSFDLTKHIVLYLRTMHSIAAAALQILINPSINNFLFTQE